MLGRYYAFFELEIDKRKIWDIFGFGLENFIYEIDKSTKIKKNFFSSVIFKLKLP